MSAARRSSVVLVSLVVAGVAGLTLWFFLRTAPAPVTLDESVSEVPTDAESIVPGVNGTWKVDTSISDFSVEGTSGTFLGFRVEEQLARIGSNTAVGRTPVVSGTVEIANDTIISATISGDLSALVSDDSRRDNRVRGALSVSIFPNATFAITAPVALDATGVENGGIEVDVTGDLTIKGVTRDIETTLQTALVRGVFVVTGSFRIVFADFGVTPPTAPAVLSVEDHGIVELQLFLSRTQL